MVRLIIFLLLIFTFLKLSTFGWRFKNNLGKIATGNDELLKNLKSHVKKLSWEIGERSVFSYENLKKASKYIKERLTLSGYTPEIQSYNVYGKEVENIIAVKKGINPREVIVVGAHYDSCFNPGADDNASGVAVLLELARLLSNQEVNQTIRFIAFVNEEPPFFKTESMGSRVYAREVKSKKENIKAVIILEMVGYYTDKPNSQRYPPLLGFFYPNKGNFLCVVGNFSSGWLVKKIVNSLRRYSQLPVESFLGPSFIAGVDFSDHWSFWKEGFSAVMLTDTAFWRHSHYHNSTDTYEKLNYETMSELTEAVYKILLYF